MRLPVPGIALLLALLAGCNTTNPDWGRGPISLSPGAQQAFDRYMAIDSALAFAVSADGRYAFFTYCQLGRLHCEDPYNEVLDGCRRATAGRIDCKIFAEGHEIVWQGKVKMASSAQLRMLQHVKNAKFCYDNASKKYYVVGVRCMLEDEEVTREAYAAGVNAGLTAYCRPASGGAFYRAAGRCHDGDRAVSERQFEQSRQYCHGGSDYYVAHGACKPGDAIVSAEEFRRATAEKAR